MNKKIVVLLCLLLLAADTFAQALTNQKIIDMATAKLSEEVIVATIVTSPSTFQTDPDSLIALSKAGVPQKVIQAMLNKTSGPAASAGVSTDVGGAAGLIPTEAGVYFIEKGRPTDPKKETVLTTRLESTAF